MFSLCFQVRQETLNFVSLDLKRTDGKHEQDIINLKVCGRVNLCLLLCLKVLLDNFCFKATCVKSGTQHNQWLELLFRRLSTLAWNYCKMAQDRSTKHCVRAIQHQICTYPRTTIQMDGTFDFANYHWGRILNSNNATQTHSIFVKI